MQLQCGDKGFFEVFLVGCKLTHLYFKRSWQLFRKKTIFAVRIGLNVKVYICTTNSQLICKTKSKWLLMSNLFSKSLNESDPLFQG